MFINVGFQEFAGVVVWRIAFAIPTNWKHQITGDHDKPLELAVDYVFPPTALMVSSILALIVAVLLTIDVCTMSETTGEKQCKTKIVCSSSGLQMFKN